MSDYKRDLDHLDHLRAKHEYLTERGEDIYQGELDDVCDAVLLGGVRYAYGRTWRDADPIAFHEASRMRFDEELGELEDAIKEGERALFGHKGV